MNAAKLVEEQQMMQRNHIEKLLILELKKNEAVKETLQLLYTKGLLTHLKLSVMNSSSKNTEQI